jgi:hypothetical protein
MKNALFVFGIMSIAVLACTPQVDACGNGGMGGMMMDDMGSSMVVVADDGSLLVTEMGMGMMGGWGSSQPALVNITSSGNERWQVSFNDGWPMMPVTDGDLVVIVVSTGGWGSWGGGQNGSQSWVYGIDLATGNQRWQINLQGGMASSPQFSTDGSRIFLTASTVNGTGGWDPMDQGGWHSGMSRGLMALDRNGNVLWERDLSGHGGGMP